MNEREEMLCILDELFANAKKREKLVNLLRAVSTVPESQKSDACALQEVERQ